MRHIPVLLKGVIEGLARLKNEGKKIIMLTGDNQLSARGFNKQINSIFDEEEVAVDEEDEEGAPIKKGLADEDDDDEVVTTKKSDDDDPIADRWL